MSKRLIGVYIIIMLIFSICGCKGMQLPDVTRNSVWNWEPELVYSEDGTSFHFAYGENGEKVSDQMLDFAKREEMLGDWGVIYYGECTFTFIDVTMKCIWLKNMTRMSSH